MLRRLVTIMAAVLLAAALAAASGPAASAQPGQAAAPGAAASAAVHVKRACGAAPAAGRAECLALVRTAADGKPLTSSPDPASPFGGYGPQQLQAAYELAAASKSRGAGQTVALVDAYDDPSADSDLAAYRALYGLPACTTANGCFRKVNQDGTAAPLPAPDAGWAVEESLDLDMVSAICPNCHIILAEANDNQDFDLAATVATAARLGATEISNSYGEPENPGETALEPFYDQPGVQVTAAAGDAGYGVGYPAASAYVTAVGGTSLWPDSTHSRGWNEEVWPGTGSGCSAVIPKPSWQHDGCTHRSDNDVAAVADPGTPVAVYDSYEDQGWINTGGTSVASPIIAAVYALLGDPKAAGGSYFYSHRGNLFDVTSGQNGACSTAYLCTAGPGYDGPTGLGTPDFTGARDSAGGSCVNGWSATPRQAFPSLAQVLAQSSLAENSSVATLSASNAWTAGFYEDSDYTGPAFTRGLVSNIEHWTGKSWSRTPSPTPVLPGGALDTTQPAAISFDRASDGWFAGTSNGTPLAAHWDGSRWSLSPVLDPVATYQVSAGQTAAALASASSVAAVSPDDAWLAGNLSSGGSFLERWNGSTWSLVSIPDLQDLDLTSLSAISASDVWAAGSTSDSSGDQIPAALHWDGHAWSLERAPVSSSPAAYFNAVSGSSADDLWAVGTQYEAGMYVPMAEHWNGSAWSVVPTPQPDMTEGHNELFGVAAISASDAWAVGRYNGTRAGQSEYIDLLEHWDGRTWTIVGTPQNPQPAGLAAISASSASNIWVAGEQFLPTAVDAVDPYNLHYGCSNG